MEIGGINSSNKGIANIESSTRIESNGDLRNSEDIGNTGEQEKTYPVDEIQKEVDNLNNWFKSNNSHLKFTLHEKLNKYYVQIIDDQTREVMNEIPSKKIMDAVANFYEMIGVIVDKKV